MSEKAERLDADLEVALVEDLERDGWAVVRGRVPADDVARALEIVRRLLEERAGESPTGSYLVEDGDPFVWDLQREDPFLLRLILSDPLVESILRRFLNDPFYRHIPAEEPNYILRALIARSNVRPLALHIDSFVPTPGDHPFVFQVAVALDDATPDNGCTVMVPGSHQAGRWAQPSDLADAVPVPLAAGDVLLWDSRTWHATGANPSGRSRWLLIATFTRWWLKQMFDTVGTLRQEIYAALTPKERSILGFCSAPPRSWRERIDMKQGWSDLADDVEEYRR